MLAAQIVQPVEKHRLRGKLRPAAGDPGLDHLQNIFLTVCVSLSGLGLLKPMKNFP